MKAREKVYHENYNCLKRLLTGQKMKEICFSTIPRDEKINSINKSLLTPDGVRMFGEHMRRYPGVFLWIVHITIAVHIQIVWDCYISMSLKNVFHFWNAYRLLHSFHHQIFVKIMKHVIVSHQCHRLIYFKKRLSKANHPERKYNGTLHHCAIVVVFLSYWHKQCSWVLG